MQQAYYDYGLQQWFSWFEQRMESLEKRQLELEAENKRLKEQLEGMKPVQYGNITYKVQELHVSELSGALNIGLTSLADESQLKHFVEKVKEGEMQVQDMQTLAEDAG